ncbi:hypothetical protein [Bradyrhizobium sp. 930_D9_N1_4]|uniref:hypothetical protein n=1 Tax=Bradyrhizobium sp. 930_D9_N1_4 TaxID=3240374 RepID=UPI003F8C03DE
MRTVLIVLGIWLLINVLFVVIMLPTRKPRKPDQQDSGTLAPVRIEQNGYPLEQQEKFVLRHVVISIGMATFFSLTAPLIEAIDSFKRFIRKRRG